MIETERLTLRLHRVEDFANTAEMWGDPVVTKHIGGKPSTTEESWHRILRNMGHWQAMGWGYWVVREKKTGRFAGEAGFAHLKRELDPSFGDTPEAGWVLSPWAHGKGFAAEAMRAALAWLGEKKRTVCMIDPDNEASLKLAAKLGYREYARTTYKGAPSVLLERG